MAYMAHMNQTIPLIPVTILTGFLGSGKTTLLNHILKARHDYRIAVIENEFGEVGIDSEILLQERGEQIVQMNNGCICCTVRGDLTRMLGELAHKRTSGELAFDRVVIETTGLADPAPVAQTFFAEDEVVREYRLDGIVTMVDAVHGPHALDANRQAQKQVGFADRIILTKTDLVTTGHAAALTQRLRRMNARAPVKAVEQGCVDAADVLDLGGFDLARALAVDADFLEPAAHQHHRHDEIASFVFRHAQALDLEKLENLLGLLIERFGDDMLRYKGVLDVADREERIVFQGVHKMLASEPGTRWAAGEVRESVIVFIGRNLPRELFLKGLSLCAHGLAADPAEVLRDWSPPVSTGAGVVPTARRSTRI
jgi:G3E family GTPase